MLGAYAFGRTMSKVSVEAGRKRIRRGLRRPSEWDVLLKDQHEGYITWSELEDQRVITNNATGKGSAVTGALRRGELLFSRLPLRSLRPQPIRGLWRESRGAITATALS